MASYYRETLFGRIVNKVSGDRYFRDPEYYNPALLEPYAIGARHSESSTPSNELANSSNEKVDDTDIAKAEKGKDYQLVEWLPNDPENPRNWSTNKKFFATFQICLLTFSIYVGSAIYTSGIEGVMEDFHVSQVVALLGLTLFVIGYALGPMVLTALCEVPFFGRNPVFISTLFIFVFLNFAVVYAKNIGMLLAFRFITGFVGSPVLASGGAVIADLYRPSKQAYGISVWGMSAVLGPTAGPIISGFAVQAKGWQWSIWELIWMSGFALVFLFFLLPETNSGNILLRRTQRYRRLTGNENLRCAPEIEAAEMSTKEVLSMVFVLPFTMTFTEPICFALHLYIALIYALLYLWFESFPIVFIGIYGFNGGELGLTFTGILVGAILTLPPFYYYLHVYLEPKFNKDGDLVPEYRLPAAFVGAFCIPLCLFWFGWTSRESIHWIVPIIGTAFFATGAFLLFQAVLGYLGDAYPKYVGSVFAGNDLVRSGFGAAFPLFANAMYTKLGVGWASSLLGFLSIVFIPIPFVLYKYGRQIRMRSKMARHDI